MDRRRLHRLAAGCVFVYALVLYGATIAPTTSFWDAGEFIASAHGLQVMHPPGAPVYMLLGRLFAMAVPAGLVAVAVNAISVLASALTVLLAYLIIVRLVRTWPGRGRTFGAEALAVAGGVIGACTFAATDSFWFSAVEAEVYALSMLFTALVVWLTLVWSEREAAARPGARNGRYLVLIAYLLGLSTGIHLMALLTFFFLALLVYFQWYERPGGGRARQALRLGLAGIVSLAAFSLIYPGMVITLPDWAGRSGAPALFLLGLGGLLGWGLFYTHRRRLGRANLALLCAAALLVGYSTYALIPIRSTANPPIDLNNPETAETLVPYLQREQYGQTPLLFGHTFDDRTGQIDTTGEALFPRRHSPLPQHTALYARYRSDADYFWRYQLGHMYTRYLLWNFAGRASDVQDAPATTGVPVHRAGQDLGQTPSERAARNVYFGLPLLLGLIGMSFHFMRDGRRALAVSVLFLATGAGLVVYLNEIPATPRERDYIYVASFFAFSLWVGIGATALLELSYGALHRFSGRLRRWTAAVLGALLLLAVPGWMAVENYDDHDRSGRYLARDFAYNMLMSLDEDAILFTEGDNDTYPLWYLQEVEGVRRDVRVVNLSLLNTVWYARQLRDQWAYDAAPVPLSLTDEQLETIDFRGWVPREVSLPVDRRRLVEQSELPVEADTSRFDSPMRWTLEGRRYNAELNVLHPVDQIAINILADNAVQGWGRPVYFATTTAFDSQLGLQPYFQREGLAYRVVPIRHEEPLGRVETGIMLDRLSRFRFTNLKDPDVYYNDQNRTLAGAAYRTSFMLAAARLAEEGRPDEALRVLDRVMDEVPPDTIPFLPFNGISLAETYREAGRAPRSVEILNQVAPRTIAAVRTAVDSPGLAAAVRQVQQVQGAYMRAEAFEEASSLGGQLADLLGDDSFRMTPEVLRRLYEENL